MPIGLKKITSATFIFCLALMWTLTAVLSQQVFWSDSEMWAATVVRGLWSESSGYALHLKPIFNLVLWMGYKISDSFNILPMHVARALFFLNACWIAYLTFLILGKWYRDSIHVRLWGLMLLSTSALFLERIYRVRSDILVTSLILLSLWWMLNLSENSTRTQKLKALLPAALTPFVTLNALFYLPFLLPFLRPHLNLRSLSSRSLLVLTLTLLGFIGLIFYINFEKSYDFFIQSFDTKSTGLGYFDMARFEHVRRWIQKDSLLFGFFGLKFLHDLILFFKTKTWPSPARSWLAVWVLLLIIFHPNRMPFFLISLLPFLVLWATDAPRVYKTKKLGSLVIILTSLLLTFFASRHAKFLYETHNNKKQKQVMSYYSRIIPKSQHLVIYDPIGILPFHDSFMWYLGPGQIQENKFMGELVQRYKPHIIFYPQRVDWLSPDFNMVFDGYTQFHKDLFLSTLTIKINENTVSSEEVLKILWQTYSTLLSPDWNFDILAFDHNNQLIPLSLVDLEGKAQTLQRSVYLEDLIFSRHIETGTSGIRLEIKPVPPENIFKNFGVYELFKFDAQL